MINTKAILTISVILNKIIFCLFFFFFLTKSVLINTNKNIRTK